MSATSIISTFHHESKKFQVLRLLNILYYDGVHRRDTSVTRTLVEKLMKRFDECFEFSHYIYPMIRIDSWYQCHSPKPARNFYELQSKPQWNAIDMSSDRFVHPLYIAFCASINESTDFSLRNNLIEKKTGVTGRIEPFSYYLYQTMVCNPRIKKADLTESTLALVLFQVADHSMMEVITEPSKFFRRLSLRSDEDPLLWDNAFTIEGCQILLCGLLRGDIECFILFRVPEDKVTGKLQEELVKQPYNTGFGKIAPILMYVGKYHELPYGGPHHLQTLKEIYYISANS